ncbi:MAG: hypothetical protein MUC36_02440 [Planctomycetes bacterium]|jgi:hypothetical protein|nr:hypothetical protein [Planctomycetota bacterium]
MNPKLADFPLELERAFPGLGVIAYWTHVTDPDDGTKLDVLRVLGVPENSVVAVDRWAYDRAYELFDLDWSFLIDVRGVEDVQAGACYADEYRRRGFAKRLREFGERVAFQYVQTVQAGCQHLARAQARFDWPSCDLGSRGAATALGYALDIQSLLTSLPLVGSDRLFGDWVHSTLPSAANTHYSLAA